MNVLFIEINDKYDLFLTQKNIPFERNNLPITITIPILINNHKNIVVYDNTSIEDYYLDHPPSVDHIKNKIYSLIKFIIGNLHNYDGNNKIINIYVEDLAISKRSMQSVSVFLEDNISYILKFIDDNKM